MAHAAGPSILAGRRGKQVLDGGGLGKWEWQEGRESDICTVPTPLALSSPGCRPCGRDLVQQQQGKMKGLIKRRGFKLILVKRIKSSGEANHPQDGRFIVGGVSSTAGGCGKGSIRVPTSQYLQG